ncbi:MAG: T9SS type A sorting domain-containing protein, partial [Bacteroidetes bacterium]|nr:T9SS type A sorting domain-containing protein [Bacteroidota bacterium]
SLEDTALVNCVTAIVEKNAGTGISVYPNPSNGQFQLIIGNGQLVTGNEQVSIYNMLGDKVYSTIITNHTSNLNLNVPGGIYFLQIKSENGIIVQKLTIDK